MKYYNRTNSCDVYGRKFGKAIREYDKNKNWTGKWTCQNCYDNKRRYDTYFPVTTDNCERCNRLFTESYRGVHYKEKKDGKLTGKRV